MPMWFPFILGKKETCTGTLSRLQTLASVDLYYINVVAVKNKTKKQ